MKTCNSLKLRLWISALALGSLTVGSYVRIRTVVAQPASAQSARRLITVVEKGDPNGPTETLTFDQTRVEELLREQNVQFRGPYKDRQRVALRALAVAKRYIGVTRANDPSQVREFMSLWDYTDLRTRYCAMGVAFATCQAYCETSPPVDYVRRGVTRTFKSTLPDVRRHYYTPHPACRVMVNAAKRRGTWVPRNRVAWKNIKPGWLVLYNWERAKNGPPVSTNSIARHVGFVDRAVRNGLYTVEFNTNIRLSGNKSDGGAVAAKTPRERPYAYVIGYIKTY